MRKIFVLALLLAALCVFPSWKSSAQVQEVWNRISLEDTEERALDETVRKIWEVFDTAARDRGLVIRLNYKPFTPVYRTVMRLDTPLGELAYYGYNLSVIGNDKAEGLSLSRSTSSEEQDSNQENKIGYARGRLGEELAYWMSLKSVESQTLSAWDVLKLESFTPIIAPQPDNENPSVSVDDAIFFFPEIKDLKLRFLNLYPKVDEPFREISFSPGRLRFGSLLDTDVSISYWKDVISGRMVAGEVYWKMTFSEFTTGEEVGLANSFFYFMQERLAKAGLIVPAVIPFSLR